MALPPEPSPDPEPAAPSPSEPRSPERADAPAGDFLVVGLGASAGGLEPMSELLKQLSPQGRLSVIVVQHLDPNRQSLLVELLQRVSPLPVRWAAEGMTLERGHVYVAPPGKCVSLRGGGLVVREQTRGGVSADITHCLRSLAEECRHRAVAVLLSGNGEDGTAGAKAIKGLGGLVFAQEPATATFPAMPASAINAGCVDRVLSAIGIGEELRKLSEQVPGLWARHAELDEDAPPAGSEADALAAIFRLLAARTGVDFSDYKLSTIKRRLVRQMTLAKVNEIGDYVALLQQNRDEVQRLYESLLINVTEFFRDPDYFEFLRETVLPELLASHPANAPLRLWVPGCSTGEEAYSLGMIVRELLEARGRGTHPVQIFGTDVSDRAIAEARAGVFTPSDVASVSPERLNRFFVKTDRGYAIQKTIRDMCVFARQNVVKDSPFSRLDLITCRNLLIYLSPKLQRKLMPIFHYALNPGGYLVLGNSESIGGHTDLFRLVDRRFRIYSRKSATHRPRFDFSVDLTPPVVPAASHRPTSMPDDFKEPFDVIREADRIVLDRHGPVGVLVNEDLDILQFRGDVSPYLTLSAGRASLNVLKLAREGLVSELQSALQEARERQARTQRPGVSVLHDRVTHVVDLDITPIDAASTKERFYLVLFRQVQELPPVRPSRRRGRKNAAEKSAEEAQVEQLRQELQSTRNYLQSTIEKYEAANQALRAASEEIQSSNEELQSTNEELETAKEELQSTNEELTTVNEELHSRQLELLQLNNDLTNLINSVHLPIIILGQDMRIRRFTPMAERVLNVIPSDIGRPLSDLNINLAVQDLPRLIAEVVDTLTIKELEVQDQQGHWYSMRLRPYRTAENRIDGVVLTLIDIHDMKRTIAELEEARDFAQAVIESAPEPLAVLTSDFRVRSVNDAFAQLFQATRDAMQGRSFFEIAHDHGGLGEFRGVLERVLGSGRRIESERVALDLPGAGLRTFTVDARQIVSGTRGYPLVLLALRAA